MMVICFDALELCGLQLVKDSCFFENNVNSLHRNTEA